MKLAAVLSPGAHLHLVLWPWRGAPRHRATRRQCESVWPEENRGKCFGTAALSGGGAEGRGSRRFSGAPYGFALVRWRVQADQNASVGALVRLCQIVRLI